MKRLIKTINEAALEASIAIGCQTADRLDRLSEGGLLQRQVGGLAAFTGILAGSPAVAIAASNNCGQGASKRLVEVIGQATNFVIGLAAAGALLAFAIGAILIIFGADRGPSRGFKWVKNGIYGLIVLAGGIFVKAVVLNFVSGATNSRGDSARCLNQGGGGSGSLGNGG